MLQHHEGCPFCHLRESQGAGGGSLVIRTQGDRYVQYGRAKRSVGVAEFREFRFYAIADGIKNVLYGRSRAPTPPEPPLHHAILASFASAPRWKILDV